MVAKNKNNFIDSKEAIDIISKYGKRISKPTLFKWVKTHKLGHQCIPGSHWYIDKNKLIKLLEKGKVC